MEMENETGKGDMAEDQPEAQGQEGGVGEMIKNLSSGLTMISQMISSMPDVDPADIKEIEDITGRFQGLMTKLSGGPAEGEEAMPQQQAPAGRGRAVPVKSMAGKPVSPAGI